MKKRATQPGSITFSQFSHDDIARRAYDIHLLKGRPSGQCESNWLQAEQELKLEALQPSRERTYATHAGSPMAVRNTTHRFSSIIMDNVDAAFPDVAT